MTNKFFSLFKPYFDSFDNGNFFKKPITVLYALFGLVNLLAPFYSLYLAINYRLFDAPSKPITLFIVIWFILAISGWISFQLWIDRMLKVDTSSIKGDEFVVTPIISHFIQTFGEWAGTWIGLVGFGISLLAKIILANDTKFLGNLIGIGHINLGWVEITLIPLLGFMIILISRFFAEQLKALSVIANNTKKV
jgi:hypothetical protein